MANLETEIRADEFPLSRFMQKLSNGKKVFDFEKIAKLEFPMVVVISERGSKGKTVNIKDFLRKEFLDTGKPSIWLANTQDFVDKSASDFTADMRKPFVERETKSGRFWHDIEFDGDVKKNNLWARWDKQDFVKFLAINNAELEKGARREYGYVIYDEFNVKSEVVRDPVGKVTSLLGTLKDPVNTLSEPPKWFIFGNNKTLNSPLIYRLGVTHLKHEVTSVYSKRGTPLLLIIAPLFDNALRAKIEQENADDWVFQITKQLGTAGHNYFNDSLYDEINSIVELANEENAHLLIPIISVFHDGNYLNLYKIKGTKRLHVVDVERKEANPNALFIFKRTDAQENHKYNADYVVAMRAHLGMNQVTFENIMARDVFVSALK